MLTVACCLVGLGLGLGLGLDISVLLVSGYAQCTRICTTFGRH